MSDFDMLHAEHVLERELEQRGDSIISWARRLLDRRGGPWICDSVRLLRDRPRREVIVKIPTCEWEEEFWNCLRAGDLEQAQERILRGVREAEGFPADVRVAALWLERARAELWIVLASSSFPVVLEGGSPEVWPLLASDVARSWVARARAAGWVVTEMRDDERQLVQVKVDIGSGLSLVSDPHPRAWLAYHQLSAGVLHYLDRA